MTLQDESALPEGTEQKIDAIIANMNEGDKPEAEEPKDRGAEPANEQEESAGREDDVIEPADEKETSTDPQEPQWDQAILGRATNEFGLTEEEVKKEFDPSTLAKAMKLADRRIAALGRQEQKPKEEPEGKAEAKIFELDPELYTPELVEFLKKQQETIDQLRQANQQVEAEAFYASFDAEMNQLPEELFGRGSVDSVDEKLADNRKQVFVAVNRTARALQAAGEEVPPLKQLIKEAYFAKFGEQIIKQAKSEQAKRVRDSGKNVTGTPGRSKQTRSGDFMADLMNDPDLIDAWNSAVER